MKFCDKILLILILSTTNFLISKAPSQFTYQSVVRTNSGSLVSNQEVSFRFTILKGTQLGSIVFEEEHTVTTNINGLATMIIGKGSGTDDLSEIDWGIDSYFLKVEVDPKGGFNYVGEDTTQLLSVPYALYSNSSGDKLTLTGKDYITLDENNQLVIDSIDLTDDVSGILPITNGGTGSATAPMVGVITAADAASARDVLGLGTAATTASTDYATAAQGALADTALQDATAFATAAQGTKADGALQLSGGTMTGNIAMTSTETVDGRDLSVDGSKLDGIEAGATADQTAAEVTSSATGNISATDVDSAIAELESEKLALSGGTMTGDLNMGTNNITNTGTVTATTFSGDLTGNAATVTINTSTVDANASPAGSSYSSTAVIGIGSRTFSSGAYERNFYAGIDLSSTSTVIVNPSESAYITAGLSYPVQLVVSIDHVNDVFTVTCYFDNFRVSPVADFDFNFIAIK